MILKVVIQDEAGGGRGKGPTDCYWLLVRVGFNPDIAPE